MPSGRRSRGGCQAGGNLSRVSRSGRLSFIIAFVVGLGVCLGPGGALAGTNSNYSAAFIDYRQNLRVFPFTGKAFSIPLPISTLVYSTNGRSLWGHSKDPYATGILKLTFHPTSVTTVPHTEAMRVASLAVNPAEDTLVISGSDPGSGSSACGIFELKLPGGEVRQVVRNASCEYAHSWVRLSLSPDSKHLVAYRKPELEVIDLASGAVRSLSGSYIAGAWSPDGKWLAVLNGGEGHRTVLLDSMTFKEERSFGETNVEWSPDSRFLLGARGQLCPPYWSSLVAVDVHTGRETLVPGSRCKVNLNTIGWVSGVGPND